MPGDFEPTPPPGDGGGSGGSGGSSGSSGSSSSSSGSSEPAVDPIVARREAMFQSIYMSLWGEPATEGYIKSIAKGGLNSYEFSLMERSKPAWQQTKAFKDAFAARAGVLKQIGL
jgi:hypothetical protein